MKNFILILILLITSTSFSQTKKWTLQECLDYARRNNLQLKQNKLQIDQAKINKNTSTMAYLPTVNANASTSWNSGLTQNFTTGVLENQTTFGGNASVSSNINLFNGLQNRYNYKKSLLEIISAQYQYKDAVKSIETQIASAYVQILLAKENLHNVQLQLENSIKQKERIVQLIDAGLSPQGDLVDAEAQISNDNMKLVQAENDYHSAKITLAQLLELNDLTNLAIDENIDALKVDEKLLFADSEVLFSKARQNNYKLKNAKTQQKIAKYQTRLAKSGYFPSLSGFVRFNTRYSDRENIGFGGIITPADPLWDQVKDNRGLTYGLSLNIPVFNGFRVKNQVKSARLNEVRNAINLENSQKQLRSDIYKMQMDAKAAFESLKAAENNLKAQQKAYDYANEKFKVGVMNIFDLNTVKLKYQNAQYQYINAKYQYYLKIKVLEYNVN